MLFRQAPAWNQAFLCLGLLATSLLLACGVVPSRSSPPLAAQSAPVVPTAAELTAQGAPAQSASVAPPPEAESPEPNPQACELLREDPLDAPRWLAAALDKYLKGRAETKAKAVAARVRAAVERGDESCARDASCGCHEYSSNNPDGDPCGNAATGVLSLAKPGLSLVGGPEGLHTSLLGARGCWGLVRTGIASIQWSSSTLQVTYAHAIAFAESNRGVTRLAVSTFWKALDPFNLLGVVDLDGDGWEEAFYSASNGSVGQAHESLAGRATLLLSSRDGELRPLPPFDEPRVQRGNWDLQDANGDGRYDWVEHRGWSRANHCRQHENTWGDAPFVTNEAVLAQGTDGTFSYANAESRSILEQRCPTDPIILKSSEDVICARIWGHCVEALRRRIRATNAPFDCGIDAQEEPQRDPRANPEYFDMLRNAAVYRPLLSLRPVCATR